MSLWTLPLSFFAGALTIVNPCVLPLVPIVVAGARAENPRAPLALAAGMAVTFGLVGGFLASLGVDFGGSPLLRDLAAALILLVGLVLIFPALAHRLEAALAPLQRLGAFLQAKLPSSGLLGQAAAGALLALVWAPCAGPTLAAAFVLAARGGSLPFAILSMSVFALGAAGALLALGYGFGRLAGAGRRAALATGAGARLLLGGAFALVGLLILTGADHLLETVLTAHMPAWLIRLAGAA
jgi:cytochrome c-type biogenesis protein